MRYNITGWIVIVFIIVSGTISGQVVKKDHPQLSRIDVDEHRGDTIPMDIILTDDHGRNKVLGDYFQDKRPKILIMAYYTCPMLCNLVLNGVAEAGSSISWRPGEEYQLLTVSIDPTETYDLAAAKKENYLNSMGYPEADSGWIFFTAEADQSRRLADAVGFKYFYDEEIEKYAHAAVIMVLTSDGVISRYLYGIEYNPRDLRLSLLEASRGRIGDALDKILLFCYHYDPDSGGYVVLASNVMKLGGVVTLILLGTFLGIYWLREWRRKKSGEGTASDNKEVAEAEATGNK